LRARMMTSRRFELSMARARHGTGIACLDATLEAARHRMRRQ
jgi:hypothetical protein